MTRVLHLCRSHAGAALLADVVQDGDLVVYTDDTITPAEQTHAIPHRVWTPALVDDRQATTVTEPELVELIFEYDRVITW